MPVIQKSVEQLGFKFSDVKILLGTHAHGDHQEGDARVKELTGAEVVVMAEDVPALRDIKPGGREHPIDRQIKDGALVVLDGTTLTAHLTPGHTRGCTTWTMQASEGGRSYDVVLACSYRAPNNVTPAIEAEFARTFTSIRSLPCDVPLGDHPAQYNMAAKHARLEARRAEPVHRSGELLGGGGDPGGDAARPDRRIEVVLSPRRHDGTRFLFTVMS